MADTGSRFNSMTGVYESCKVSHCSRCLADAALCEMCRDGFRLEGSQKCHFQLEALFYEVDSAVDNQRDLFYALEVRGAGLLFKDDNSLLAGMLQSMVNIELGSKSGGKDGTAKVEVRIAYQGRQQDYFLVSGKIVGEADREVNQAVLRLTMTEKNLVVGAEEGRIESVS